jgi:hypothetical protein
VQYLGDTLMSEVALMQNDGFGSFAMSFSSTAK